MQRKCVHSLSFYCSQNSERSPDADGRQEEIGCEDHVCVAHMLFPRLFLLICNLQSQFSSIRMGPKLQNLSFC